MADNKSKGKEITDEEAEEMRAKLAERDARIAEERVKELKKRYKETHEFLQSSQVKWILEKTEKLKAQLASSEEDRTLYFALDNMRIGLSALGVELNRRASAVGIKFDDADDNVNKEGKENA